MKSLALKSLTLATVITGLVACGRAGPEPTVNDPVTADDIVSVDDILLEDAENAALSAAQVGDPATLLGAAQEAGTTIRGHMRDVFGFLKAVTDTEPAESGINENGKPYAVWTGSRDGVDFRLGVARTAPRRVRYVLTAKQSAAAEEFKGILTGVFIKRAPHRGGGRLHINLSNLSDVRGADVDGSVHVAFANGRDDKQGRRIAYLNLRNRNEPDAEPQAFGADLIRKVGEGGRFRTLHVADMNPAIEGFEAIGLRVLWKNGVGGRADAVIARVAPRPVVVLGHAHECFDADGLRTGYADTFPGNDEIDPNEGEVRNCFDLEQTDVPDEAVTDGSDTDPELDDLLAEDEADTVSEDEAANDDEVNI